jgi:hypothetical protein
MDIEGYREYRRREFCNDVRCPVQVELNRHAQGSENYEKIRAECKGVCRHTTHEFHKWLIEKGFLIVKKESSISGESV